MNTDDIRTERRTLPLATVCGACPHALNWHSKDEGCLVGGCRCARFVPRAADEDPVDPLDGYGKRRPLSVPRPAAEPVPDGANALHSRLAAMEDRLTSRLAAVTDLVERARDHGNASVDTDLLAEALGLDNPPNPPAPRLPLGPWWQGLLDHISGGCSTCTPDTPVGEMCKEGRRVVSDAVNRVAPNSAGGDGGPS